MRFRVLAILIATCGLAMAQRSSSAGGSPEHRSDVEITWHIFKPPERPAPDFSQLHAPTGFRIQRFAENIGNARILAIGPNGNVYVTRREGGDILMFRVGADGVAIGQPLRVASRSGLHGIAFSKGKVYLAAVQEVFKADVRPDGTFGPLDMIIHDLPDAGLHNTRTVQIGPDDMMYMSIGSTCNECTEPNPENASLLRASLDGKTRSIFASGLRDTVGWGWQPQTGELWGMDNGMDALGDNLQPEELNHLEKGKRYGWPYLFGDNQANPHLDPPGGIFCGAAALAGASFVAFNEAVAQDLSSANSLIKTSETTSHIVREPHEPKGDPTTAEILVDTLIRWGVSHVFGLVGDGINPIIEALRKRKSEIQFVGVRHQEAAVFMAGGFAKHTGKLGVCLGTTGPGAIHLMNGLYDAHYDGAPVLAITETTFHDLIGTRFMQGVDTVKLMEPVAALNVQITGPAHASIVVNRACRTALGNRCVAHVTIPKDLQAMKLSADKPSMENHGLRTSESWSPVESAPDTQQLQAAASILKSGKRVAILAGQGALAARAEVQKIAETFGAPVAKALLGKAVLPDDSPYTTGCIGHLGTQPSQWIMQSCDTRLILGSTLPWIDSYPKQGSARAIQIDIKADHIGLRYPTELGLVGDVKTTLAALLPLLQHKADRYFLREAQRRMQDWLKLLDQVERVERSPLRPQMVERALSDLIAPDAVISLDCGSNTFFAARHLLVPEGQRLTSPGMLATMAPGLPFAIAAQFAHPNRESVAVVGDGGFAMLMAELTTAVQHNLAVKIVVLKNNSLSEVRFEQQELGNPPCGCDLGPIDFVGFAKACGADGFRCATPAEVRPAPTSALRSPKAAIVEAVVDPDEPPAKPQEVRA